MSQSPAAHLAGVLRDRGVETTATSDMDLSGPNGLEIHIRMDHLPGISAFWDSGETFYAPRLSRPIDYYTFLDDIVKGVS